MRTVPRACRAALAAAATMLVLAGCLPSSPRGGDDVEELSAALSDIPGVATGEVRLDVWTNGFTQNRTAVVIVEVDPGATLGVSEAEALEYFLRVGWAVNEGEPNEVIVVAVRDAAGTQLAWDVEAAAAELGLVDSVSVREDSTSIWFDRRGEPTGLSEFLGPWPGEPPTPPDGLFTTG
jgi:hypothetical protein